MTTVTFCGHSQIPSYDETIVKAKLHSEIEKLINQGAKTFLLGGYGSFDLLCAKTVKELKKSHPHIKSVLVIPYLDRDYNLNLYDCSEYPPIETVPKRLAIIKRNEYMVDACNILVAYVRVSYGGAYKTLRYAKQKHKVIINLADFCIST